MTTKDLIRVIEAETILMRELALVEQGMLRSLMTRSSGGIHENQARVADLSQHIERAEDLRLNLIRQLASQYGITSHPASSVAPVELFGRLLERLSYTEREALNTTMRAFRIAMQELLGMNQAIHSYTQAQLVTLDSFLTELFPHRNRDTYGADGRVQMNSSPQMFNQQA